MRCLCLMGADGDLPQWRDPRSWTAYPAVGLTDLATTPASPLLAAFTQGFGIDLPRFLRGEEHPQPGRDSFETFYIAKATGDPRVPAQEFIREHGIGSVLGFGGLFPDGEAFCVTLFTRTRVPAPVAAMFDAVAVATRLALLPFTVAPLFAGLPARPANPLAVASSRVRALEQMIAVQQKAVIAQANRLETAYEEAVVTRRLVEREAAATETLRHISTTLSAELDLDRLVQAATDAGTQLTGASFGAFFYNVVSLEGEAFMRYTLSGAPREEFSKFGMPRSTAVFDPTFQRIGLVRSDDIREHPAYGQNPPHHGIPWGTAWWSATSRSRSCPARATCTAGSSSATTRPGSSTSGPSGWPWASPRRPRSRWTTPGSTRPRRTPR